MLHLWHGRALYSLQFASNVPIEIDSDADPPLQRSGIRTLGVLMRLMHLCYAALGFAVARWVFRREPMPITDPVTRLRSSGLL